MKLVKYDLGTAIQDGDNILGWINKTLRDNYKLTIQGEEPVVVQYLSQAVSLASQYFGVTMLNPEHKDNPLLCQDDVSKAEPSQVEFLKEYYKNSSEKI